VREQIAWFNEHDVCPTCTQPITETFRGKHINELVFIEAACGDELSTAIAAVESATAAVKRLETKRQQVARDFSVLEPLSRELKRLKSHADTLTRNATRIHNEANPYTTQRLRAEREQRRVTGEIATKRQEEAAAQRELAAYDYWRAERGGFRKVRLYCLESVLQELELETRNSLMQLGLLGWSVKYSTATETQRGTQRLGVQVQIQAPQSPLGRFEAVSLGEGQRARLAASLGLASLIQRWAGVWWNTEIWDEPTNWLSEEGVSDLLDCLVHRARAMDKSIWLADHRSLAHSGFTEIYMVVKDQSGSQWQQVQWQTTTEDHRRQP
jgi:DNA repair exonuclease SbcCD ATPase subunit